MGIPKVIYFDGKPRENSWITYMTRRNEQFNNNMIAIVGKVGTGKTWSALSICEMMSLVNGVPFNIDQVVFSLRDLLRLVNSGKLREGSCIIYDEPQITISARSFMSLSNRTFNFLGTTWRHRRFNLFFCTPFADLLDLNARKLFNIKLTTKGIDRTTNHVKLRPVMTEYNSTNKIFYEHYLRVVYKPEDRQKYVSVKLKEWRIPKPSESLIDVYEKKKLAFTSALNRELEKSLEAFERKQRAKEIADKQHPDKDADADELKKIEDELKKLKDDKDDFVLPK